MTVIQLVPGVCLADGQVPADLGLAVIAAIIPAPRDPGPCAAAVDSSGSTGGDTAGPDPAAGTLTSCYLGSSLRVNLRMLARLLVRRLTGALLAEALHRRGSGAYRYAFRA